MTAQTLPTATTATGVDNEIDHIHCWCDPDTAYCGLDVSNMPDGATWVNTCVVCDDVDRSGMHVCGGQP